MVGIHAFIQKEVKIMAKNKQSPKGPDSNTVGVQVLHGYVGFTATYSLIKKDV